MAFKKYIPSVQAVQAYLSLHATKRIWELLGAGSWELGLLTFISTRAPSVYSTGATPGLAIWEICRIFWGEKIELPTSRRLEWCPDTWFVEKWRQTSEFFYEISSLSQKIYHFQEKLTRLPTCMGRTSINQWNPNSHTISTSGWPALPGLSLL